MAIYVPYRSNGAARAMIDRAMTTTGTRAHGRIPLAQGLRVPAPPPRRLADLCCTRPLGAYAQAKRLGALGTTPALLNESFTGIKTGVAVTGISTAVGTSIAGAIGAGAAAGSVVPIIGTAIGAIVGLLASGILNHKTDPEVGDFNQAMALYKQNPANVVNIADKYLVIAGLFDLQPSQIKGNIPIYKKYGRMGEQRFITDMCMKIYQAGLAGQITGNDTPMSVMTRIVQPWIDSFGFGPMTDSNADMITLVLVGMIADYVTGNQKTWYAVGGDFPFGSLPPFSLYQAPPAALPAPVAAAPAPAAPAPVAAPPTDAQVLAAQGWRQIGTDANGNGIYVNNSQPGQFTWINGNLVPLAQQAPTAAFFGTATTAPPPAPSANCAAPYVWNGTQCVLPNNALPLPAAPATTGPPAGFSPVGTDASGNPIYANAQGVLYSWTGTGMQIFSGQLATGNSAAAQMQAALQNALAQGQSAQQAAAAALQQAQTAGVAITPQVQQQVAAQVSATQAAPPTPIAAGIGSGLSSTASIISIAATVIGLMLATAHPAKQPTARRARRRRG